MSKMSIDDAQRTLRHVKKHEADGGAGNDWHTNPDECELHREILGGARVKLQQAVDWANRRKADEADLSDLSHDELTEIYQTVEWEVDVDSEDDDLVARIQSFSHLIFLCAQRFAHQPRRSIRRLDALVRSMLTLSAEMVRQWSQ